MKHLLGSVVKRLSYSFRRSFSSSCLLSSLGFWSTNWLHAWVVHWFPHQL